MAGGDSEAALATLFLTGNMDRLVIEARRFLAIDPEDVSAHYYLTLALGRMERFKEAAKHLKVILQQDPENTRHQCAAIRHYLDQERWSAAQKHADALLRLDPHGAVSHYYAAYLHHRCLRQDEAKAAIDRARHLAPDDADVVNLHIRIHSLEETSAADALKRLAEYKDALMLDPENPWLHQSIGDVHSIGLGDPVTAQVHYREALRLQPGNRDFQKALFAAVAESSLIYRLFSIPSRQWTYVGNALTVLRYEPWRLVILLLFAVKFLLIYFIWLAMITVLFLPGGKVYEWLLVSEIKRGKVADLVGLRTWFWFRRWPGYVRFTLFLLVNALLWGALFLALEIPPATGFRFVGYFAAFHFAWVVAWTAYQKIRRWHGRRHMRR